jgi:hypothetical protein
MFDSEHEILKQKFEMVGKKITKINAEIWWAESKHNLWIFKNTHIKKNSIKRQEKRSN